jgi:hypothetical protein
LKTFASNGSQKLDIEDICDAIVDSIDGNVSNILSAAEGETLTREQMQAHDLFGSINSRLGEIVQHLRVITNEDFRYED